MSHSTTPSFDQTWPPRRLTVVYDDQCEVCVRCSRWLAAQPTHVELRFLASSEPDVYDTYGDLPWFRIELMVVTDSGLAWTGSRAFIMCLWATVQWHHMSYRLSGPSLTRVAERFFHVVSANRSLVSGMLKPTTCTDGACHRPPVQSGSAATHVAQ